VQLHTCSHVNASVGALAGSFGSPPTQKNGPHADRQPIRETQLWITILQPNESDGSPAVAGPVEHAGNGDSTHAEQEPSSRSSGP